MAGGAQQVLEGKAPREGFEVFKSTFGRVFGIRTKSKDITLKPLKPGARVVAGTILGRIGQARRSSRRTCCSRSARPAAARRASTRSRSSTAGSCWSRPPIYRAAGKNPFFGADAKAPSIGQVLLMSKESLERQVLADPRVEIYECGRRDIRLGAIDRRVLATVEFLSASGLKPTITSLTCGHGYLTRVGQRVRASSGNAMDIAKVNGIPIIGHQGAGSITEITIQRLLTLQGLMKPHQIISLMTFEDADNTYAMGDHDDHIHVGFQPLYGTNSKAAKQVNAILKPDQWIKLIDRLGEIDNPGVGVAPSKYAIESEEGRQPRHRGD